MNKVLTIYHNFGIIFIKGGNKNGNYFRIWGCNILCYLFD